MYIDSYINDRYQLKIDTLVDLFIDKIARQIYKQIARYIQTIIHFSRTLCVYMMTSLVYSKNILYAYTFSLKLNIKRQTFKNFFSSNYFQSPMFKENSEKNSYLYTTSLLI